jgi:hypothetical protein
MTLGDGIRRDIATISQEERDLFVNALRQLDDPASAFVFGANAGHEGADASGNITYWDMQEQIHKDAHAHGSDVHSGPAFAPWHRVIVSRLEAMLRQVDPRLSLHYWDWTKDPRVDSIDRSAILGPTGTLGSASGNAGPPLADFESSEKVDTAHGGDGIHDHVWRGVLAGVPGLAADATILGNATFTSFNAALQSAHNTAHGYIGGTLGHAHFSFHDPMVFLLHSNMDRLWAMWQRDPAHPDRLVPATAYGTVLADLGLPATYFDEWVAPWSGVDNAAHPATDLNPWRTDVSQQAHVSYLDPSVITPPSYDTAPHLSYIVTDRDTFSSYEVESSSSYPDAFWVIYDGFAPSTLGSTLPTVTLTFDSPSGPAASGMTTSVGAAQLEAPAAPTVPQRVMFPVTLQFTDVSAFATFIETRAVVVKASHGTISAQAQLTLIKQPNPYLVDGPVSWLSTDVRVFQMRPGMARAGVTQADPGPNPTAPHDFVTNLLTAFNSLPNDASHPFLALPTDQAASGLELSRTVGGVPVLNYAVAKIRYRANTVAASNVRVFFRTFNTMLSALDYNTTLNYPRAAVAGSAVPLLGVIDGQTASMPFFATQRIDSATQSMSAQSDPPNERTINAAGAAESVMYFGCWLDINQPAPQFPLSPSGSGPFTSGRLAIPQLIRGHHQCLVAEIFFQPGGTDPIPAGATPASSDRLGQRNLAIVESDNPGNAATHTVQHTFAIKAVPRPRVGKGGNGNGSAVRQPVHSELAIRWHNLPADARATIYVPQWNADEVLAIAAARQHPTVLSKVDDHTVACGIADVSYLPVPGDARQTQVGLISIELPKSVRAGEEFHVDVRQYVTAESRPDRERPGLRMIGKFVGAFQLTIPVRMPDKLIPREIRKLAVLRYIAQAIPVEDRWRAVFTRYLAQLEAKLRGLGVDPKRVRASLDDPSTGKPGPDGAGYLPGQGDLVGDELE